MNWVDLVWLFAVLTGAFSGLHGGVLSELLRIACWGAIIEMGLKLAPATELTTLVGLVVGLLVVAWIIRKLVCKIAGPPGWLSRLAGVLLGAARMAALMILLTLGVARLQSPFWRRQVCIESRCGMTVLTLFQNMPATNQIQRTI